MAMGVGICKSMLYIFAPPLRKWAAFAILGIIAEVMIFTLAMQDGDVGSLTYYSTLATLIACKS